MRSPPRRTLLRTPYAGRRVSRSWRRLTSNTRGGACDATTGGSTFAPDPSAVGAFQPGGQGLHHLFLQPAQVGVHRECWSSWIGLGKALLVHVLGDVQPGSQHQPEVVERSEPRRELLLGQMICVDRLLDDPEGFPLLGQQVVSDQMAVLHLKLWLVRISRRKKPAKGGVVSSQQR